MKVKILYIERKPFGNVSLEKVFRQVAKSLDRKKFAADFQTLPYFNGVWGTIKNLLFYRKVSADIYHITGQNHYIGLILPSERTVLTIHDVGILNIRKGLRRYLIKKLNFDLPIRRLKYITTISETIKQEILLHTKCAPEKIRVIENPLQEHLKLTETESAAVKFDADCPIILQIGTAYNKNLKNLIKAVEGINCRLVIIGKLNGEIVGNLKRCGICYENKFDLTDEEIRNEYLKTDIVSFCSTYEGFGLPIIEAQSMRKPVLTSFISPLKEVAGDYAAFADPNDYVSIREGLRKIISDERYRNSLLESGSENAIRFDAGTIAAQYENLYLKIIESQKEY